MAEANIHWTTRQHFMWFITHFATGSEDLVFEKRSRQSVLPCKHKGHRRTHTEASFKLPGSSCLRFTTPSVALMAWPWAFWIHAFIKTASTRNRDPCKDIPAKRARLKSNRQIPWHPDIQSTVERSIRDICELHRDDTEFLSRWFKVTFWSLI